MPSKETINMVLDKIGYEKFPEHLEILYDNHRIIQVKGGWRCGKSSIGSAYLLTRYWLGSHYAIIGVDYDLCRYEFGYLKDWAYKLGIVEECHFPSRDQCQLILSRGGGAKPTIIETKSAKYPERIAGVAYDGVLLVEAAQLPHGIFEIAQGRLAEKDGWMLMTGTLEIGLLSDWYIDKARDYAIPDNPDGGISYSLPSWVNRLKNVFPGGRNDPKLLQQEAILGHDAFMIRYGGEIIVPKDLVLPEFKSMLHTGRFPYNPNHPVYIGVDPGYYPSAYAVEFIQFIDNEIYVFDEIYQQHFDTEDIIKMVESKPFYDKIEDGAIDRAAKQRGEKPVYRQWRDKTGLALRTTIISDLRDGISRLRSFFIPHPVHKNVRIHINNTCRGLISELGGCKSPFADEGRGSWRIKPNGKPDERNSDACKALMYAVVARHGLAPRRRGALVSYLKEV